MDRVVLVGNGGELLGKNLGAVIDSFDVVIRCNDYRPTTKEHPQDYGQRTDVTVWSTQRAKDWKLVVWYTKDIFNPRDYHPTHSFSRGGMAALLALREFALEELPMLGMEALLNGQKFDEPLWSQKRKKKLMRTHHWDQEIQILSRVFKDRGVIIKRWQDYVNH